MSSTRPRRQSAVAQLLSRMTLDQKLAELRGDNSGTYADTWGTSLAAQYGNVVGSEQRGKGDDVDLGPTVNMARPRSPGRVWPRASRTTSRPPDR